MTTTISTISLTPEHAKFLSENKVKLSHIVRQALQEHIDEATGKKLDNYASLQAKVERLTSIVDGYVAYLQKNMLMDDFLRSDTSEVKKE